MKTKKCEGGAVLAPPGPWLTIKEAVQYSRLSKTTLKGLLRSGRLPAHRPTARRVLIRREELDRVLTGELDKPEG